jgi:O-antigen/teichoic acid export membrane protein
MARERDIRLLVRVTALCVCVAASGSLLGHYLGPAIIPRLLGAKWAASLPVLDVFFIGIVVHVVVLMAGYPLGAALNRLDVANTSVIVATILHAAGAGILIVLGQATPSAFAWLLVMSETYLLAHCAIVLLPLARRAYALAPTRALGLAAARRDEI